MRFVLLGHMDPNDEAFWSGIPMQIGQSLRAAGHEVATIGPLEPGVTFWGRIKGRFYRHAFGKNYLINRDPAVLRARAVQANRLLRQQAAADAVVVVYPPDAAYLTCPAPLILIHDATWFGLLDFYPGHERHYIARETIEGGIALDRLALENCDRAIYASDWAAESAIRGYGIDRSKVAVLPLGAGLTAAPDQADIKQWLEKRLQGPCRLLFVGKEWHRKGGDIAIEVARRLHDGGMAVELDIVGCHPPGDVPSFVRAFGFLSKNDPAKAALMQRLFQEASFVIMPSRAECFGMVFCEAAAYGLPVVTTKVGGIPEILDGRGWGAMLSPTAPPEDFARWIRTSLDDHVAYERMAWSARRDFDQRLNWGVFCRELVATIEGIRRDRRAGIAGTTGRGTQIAAL